jgi:hypothetical protein
MKELVISEATKRHYAMISIKYKYRFVQLHNKLTKNKTPVTLRYNVKEAEEKLVREIMASPDKELERCLKDYEQTPNAFALVKLQESLNKGNKVHKAIQFVVSNGFKSIIDAL